MVHNLRTKLKQDYKMDSYHVTTGRRNDEWEIRMAVDITDDTVVLTEQLYNPQTYGIIEGRKLAAGSVAFAEKIASAAKEDICCFLKEKKDKGLLSIEHLHRQCERNGVNYTLTGERIATAYRRYLKQLRESRGERYAQGARLWARATALMLAKSPDKTRIVEMLEEAISLGYISAYERLSDWYYFIEKDFAKALQINSEGVNAGDGKSMLDLAFVLSGGLDDRLPENNRIEHDYKRAAELYIAAGACGEHRRAAQGLAQLIYDGVYTPKATSYMKLISMAARAEKERSDTYIPTDPELKKAYTLLFQRPVDPEAAIELLNNALSEGKNEAYAYLVSAYMRMGEVGKAVRTALEGVKAGNKSCFFLLSKIYYRGVDFAEATGGARLSRHDYENAVRWCVLAVDEGVTEAQPFLDMLFKRCINRRITVEVSL